jgi:hypothetical protein
MSKGGEASPFYMKFKGLYMLYLFLLSYRFFKNPFNLSLLNLDEHDGDFIKGDE